MEKTAGSDSIPAEVMKPTELVHKLFSRVCETEEIPACWMDFYMVPKKEDLQECESYRGKML